MGAHCVSRSRSDMRGGETTAVTCFLLIPSGVQQLLRPATGSGGCAGASCRTESHAGRKPARRETRRRLTRQIPRIPSSQGQGGLVEKLEPGDASGSDGERAIGLAVSSALLLNACGGAGSSDSPAPVGHAPPPVPPTPIPPPPAPGPVPPPPQDTVPATDAEAARILLQAQFSVRDTDIAALKR